MGAALHRLRDLCVEIAVAISTVIALFWILRNPAKFEQTARKISTEFSSGICALLDDKKD